MMKIQTNKLFRVLTVWLTLLLLTVTLIVVVNAQPAESAIQDDPTPEKDSDSAPANAAVVDEDAVGALPALGTGIVSEPKGATGSEIYLIRLSDAPLASYRGGIPGLEATHPGTRGQSKLDANSADAIAYRDYLLDKQSQLVAAMEQVLGRSVDVAYQYYAANNGIAVSLTPDEARAVSRLPGVVFVQRNLERELHTDNGPTWIGAPSIWSATQTTRDFYAELDESQEVPPTGSSATGTGTFTYDFQTKELTWDISHTGLVSITAAHIHSATVGVNGGIEIPLDETINPITGSATLSDDQEWGLVNGLFYVNIHTEDNTGGEIRGQIWQTGNMGEGIIIGVIDTGINPSNPSFADVGDDSYDHTNPWGAGTYAGVCDPGDPSYDPTFPCNDKLIGAWGYPSVNSGDPRDYDGHGSHTASTAGGNFVYSATVQAPTIVITPSISGVAPHANIVAYAACCTLAALTAAIDQVVIDGVNVVNYSIGSDAPSDLWNDFDAVGYLNARDAGIFVATSAGNNGPGPETIGSPGDAPWILSVGATTHGRSFLNTVQDMSGGDTTPPADIEGKGLTVGYGPAPIVYAGDFGDDICLNPFPAGTWTNGEIVVCDRGINARVEKGQNVLDGGAGGMVLANVAANGEGFGTLNGDSHFLPAVHIANADGLVLKAWLASGSGHMATISGVSFSGAFGDIMAGFSSRGANRAVPDIIVPSVSAPGVDIIAATGTADSIEWNVISGTSMASPHAAGAAALLMATNPGWSPAEIQSVMMTTAHTDVWDNDGVTPADPFAMGSGRVELSTAMNAGLVLDETTTNYEDANPALGGDPKTLNLASLGNSQCLISCSWTRTVSSTQSVPVTWTASISAPTGMVLTVDPATFVLSPFGTQTISVTADISGLPNDQWAFAEISFSPDGGPNIAEAHFPVAVVPASGVVPTSIDIDTRRDAGSQLVAGIESIEVTDLTVDIIGLTKADQHQDQLFEDNDTSADFPDIFFDDLDGAFWLTMTVPVDAYSVNAEVVSTTSPDLDMIVGFDGDGDGLPSLQDTVLNPDDFCQSATAGSSESCTLFNPLPGTWWVVVINFEESVPGEADDVTVATAVVDGADNGNMSVEGPTSVPPLTPYDIRVFWNDPSMEAGDLLYGAISLGSDPANPGNIATIPVFLTRHEDDVVKEASVSEATPGMTVSYTITVQPNVTPEDLAYTITDTIPAGMTYVPGSAAASSGSVTVLGDTVMWSGLLEVPGFTYNVETSVTDSVGCAAPLSSADGESDAYVNLEAFSILTNPSISGDTVWYSFNPSGGEFEFFGDLHGEDINFTDDGFAFFDPSTPSGTPWANQPIPTPDDPNNLMAIFWRDLEIVYDAGLNRGVSLANLTTAGVPVAAVIEYDDVEDYPAGSNPTYDFEVIAYYEADPDRYEYIFAYDNLTGDVITGTIGLENSDGTDGIQYAFDNITITDGMAVCFDQVGAGGSDVTITYQTTVDAGTAPGTVLTNNAEHNTDNPGSLPAVASTDVMIPGSQIYLPVLIKD